MDIILGAVGTRSESRRILYHAKIATLKADWWRMVNCLRNRQKQLFRQNCCAEDDAQKSE